jgi:hypothetical protein
MSKITPYEPLTSSFEDFIGIYPNKSSPNNSITTKDSRFPLSEYYNPFKLKISKKTNRGRKENFSLPKDLITCDICLKYSEFSEESESVRFYWNSEKLTLPYERCSMKRG